MSLAAILAAIEAAGRPLTPAELAAATGIDAGRVAGLLDALRANGMLAPEGSAGGPPDGCAAGGACRGSCPGSGECPLVIDLGFGGLVPRGSG